MHQISRRAAVHGALFGSALVGATAKARDAAAAPPQSVWTVAPDPAMSDHIPLLQAAVDRIERAGGGCLSLAPGQYRCLSGPLRLDPTRTSIAGFGAILDFSSRPRTSSRVTGSLLLAASARSSQYGHHAQRFEGFRLVGSRQDPDSVGVILRTAVEAKSSRTCLSNIDISGFGAGIQFMDRSYLSQLFSVGVHGCDKCVVCAEPSADSGENISFYGCTLFNSRVAIDNAMGAALSFFGCAFDYVDQWYEGIGAADFFGCNFEKHKPRVDLAPFILGGAGALRFFGGFMMISGHEFAEAPQNSTIFDIRHKMGRVLLDSVGVWNLRGHTGALASGPGRLVTRNLVGIGNRHLSGIPALTAKHDLFGGQGNFESDAIGVQVDVTAGKADGSTAHAAQCGSVSLTSTEALEGRQCLRIHKSGGRGDPLVLRFFAPSHQLTMPSLEFSWKMGGQCHGDGRFWIRLASVQSIGSTPDGRTVVGAREYIGPVLERRFSSAGNSWDRVFVGTTYVDDSVETDNQISPWSTHIVIELNLADLDAGCDLLIDNLRLYNV